MYTLAGVEGELQFYSAGADGMIVLWQAGKDDGLMVAKSDAPIYALYADEQYLIAGSNKGVLTILLRNGHKLVKEIKLSAGAVFDIQKSDGDYLFACADGNMYVADGNFNITRSLHLSDKPLRKILIAEKQLYIAGSDAVIRKLNHRFEVAAIFKDHHLSVFALEITNGQLLSAGRDAVIRVHNTSGLQYTVNAHWYPINDIKLNSSGKYFASASLDKSIKIWDADNFALLKVIERPKMDAHQSSVNKILWIDRNRFISCSDDRTLKCFEIIE